VTHLSKIPRIKWFQLNFLQVVVIQDESGLNGQTHCTESIQVFGNK